jgi:membrane fusion protein (multidrug efflux system)
LLLALVAGGCTKHAENGGEAAVRSPDAGGKGGKGAGGRGGRGGGGGGQAQPVEVVALQRRDLVERLNLVGSLTPNESAELRAEIPGQVRRIDFEEGRRVEKGQILLKIDDAELLAQRAQTEARFKLTELNLQRAENLRQSNSTTQADYDRARAEYATAQAELALLRVRLEKTEVKAPFAGAVGGRTISVGDYVNTTTVITVLNDLDRMKIVFQVPERYLAKVHPGTIFKVRSSALGSDAAVQGEVYYVNSVIDRATRSTEVKGFLNNPPPALKAGMFANIELELETRRGALTVPEGAILISQQGPQLIAVKEQKGEKVAEFVPVQLGLRTRGVVEVTPVKGELPENLSIVAAGVGSLAIYPGARLDPRPLRTEFRVGD